ncbi:DUF29 domain-containing protein [Pseudanabaena sp. FACHB-1277]|uniref:DUF29 domain-containing protein n=1 Tax=Pseudanabaena cinerea FACHB-1277 TaxID=2949581 RepID=A0A926UV98_9CYAN|nr:DUF29 domain-containing protein [Pseudanabaena cinerea]MBD2150657.1 DUF29 domain-containing protein [Pseudanabaena cinerea FACHB-1277]
MTQTVVLQSLYESDYLLWTQEVVLKLKARDFDNVDLENLIEEIEDLGHSKKDELKSRLNTLLEHLLKRIYVDMPQEFNGWQRTIREQRKRLDWLLDANPSLKTVWNDTFNIAWRYALRDVREDYPQYQFPNTWQFGRDIETVLNTVFWK